MPNKVPRVWAVATPFTQLSTISSRPATQNPTNKRKRIHESGLNDQGVRQDGSTGKGANTARMPVLPDTEDDSQAVNASQNESDRIERENQAGARGRISSSSRRKLAVVWKRLKRIPRLASRSIVGMRTGAAEARWCREPGIVGHEHEDVGRILRKAWWLATPLVLRVRQRAAGDARTRSRCERKGGTCGWCAHGDGIDLQLSRLL